MISIKQQNRGVQHDQAQSNDRPSQAAVSPLVKAFEAVLGALASVGESAEKDSENRSDIPTAQSVGNSLPVIEMQAASFAGIVDLVAARSVQADSNGLPAETSGLVIPAVSKLVGRDPATFQVESLDKASLGADRSFRYLADADIDSRRVGTGFVAFSGVVGGQDFDGENVKRMAIPFDLTSDRAGYKHRNSQEVVEADPVDGGMGLGALLADQKSSGLTEELVASGVGRLLSDSDLHPARSEKASRADSRVAMTGLVSDSSQQALALNSLSGEGLAHEISGSTVDSKSFVLPGRNDVQIGSTISWLASQKGGVVSLDLSPPDIGYLRMELRLDSVSERATLIVQASTEAARAAIEQSIDKLRQAFDTSGLELSVSVQTGSGGWSNQSGNSALSQSNWQNSNLSGPVRGPKEGLEAVHGAKKLSSELSLYV